MLLTPCHTPLWPCLPVIGTVCLHGYIQGFTISFGKHRSLGRSRLLSRLCRPTITMLFALALQSHVKQFLSNLSILPLRPSISYVWHDRMNTSESAWNGSKEAFMYILTCFLRTTSLCTYISCRLHINRQRDKSAINHDPLPLDHAGKSVHPQSRFRSRYGVHTNKSSIFSKQSKPTV